jgi:Sugar phosphate isomerases/epimerases
MKKSINAWSVAHGTDFSELFAQLSAAGFDGVELNIDGDNSSRHSLTESITDAELSEIKALSDKYKLPVVSISTSQYEGGAKLGSRDPARVKAGQDLLRCQLRCAKALGAGGILIVPGGISPDCSIGEAFSNSLESLKPLIPEIEAAKINVGVENVWNGFFMSPFDMCRFVDELDCKYLGAYYDVGNVIAFSWSEYWIELLGSRIKNIHIKGYKRNGSINNGGEWVDLLKGDVNWVKVVPALRAAGFDGYLTAEVGKSDPTQSWADYYAELADTVGKICAM